jgi:hypothetical protein
MMERVDEDGQAQESSRGGTEQIGWVGTQRGPAACQQGERPPGRLGQKPQEGRRGAAQCATAASWRRKKPLIF